MKAWEIWSWQPPGWPQAHPAVIISHPARVMNKPEVNVLMCSTQHSLIREAKEGEVILDAADGLNWPTSCRCDLIFLVPKQDLKNQRGRVTAERRTAIIRAINRTNDWL